MRIHPVAKTDPANEIDDFLAIVLRLVTGDPQWQGDILESCQMVEKAEVLKDHPDPTAQR